MNDWRIYRGDGEQHPGVEDLPDPPPWRIFEKITGTPSADLSRAGWSPSDLRRGKSYRAAPSLLNPVNAALYLRRPLLVQGLPGVGKSTLAYSVAYELGLGPVLRWSITSTSKLTDGLYSYDAIGRLQDVNMNAAADRTVIGRYLRLGPLGTALLPRATPRVLLIDEIDKADVDLPNDLLGVFEEGSYEIPELVRIADISPKVPVRTADSPESSEGLVTKGLVHCSQFPFVVMSTNDERQFPPAFLRRCLRVTIERPGLEELERIVSAQLGPELTAKAAHIIRKYHVDSEKGVLATDQLFNAIKLTCGTLLPKDQEDELIKLALEPLARSN